MRVLRKILQYSPTLEGNTYGLKFLMGDRFCLGTPACPADSIELVQSVINLEQHCSIDGKFGLWNAWWDYGKNSQTREQSQVQAGQRNAGVGSRVIKRRPRFSGTVGRSVLTSFPDLGSLQDTNHWQFFYSMSALIAYGPRRARSRLWRFQSQPPDMWYLSPDIRQLG